MKNVFTDIPSGAPPFPNVPYVNATSVPPGKVLVFISGQCGVHSDWSAAPSYAEQCMLLCQNIKANLEAVGMKPRDIVKWTIFLSHSAMTEEERRLLGKPMFAAAREILDLTDDPSSQWASTLIWVYALAKPDLKVEVDLVCCGDAAAQGEPPESTVNGHGLMKHITPPLSLDTNEQKHKERGYAATLAKRCEVPLEKLRQTEGRMYKFDVMRLVQPLDASAALTLADAVYEACSEQKISTGCADGQYLFDKERTSFSRSRLLAESAGGENGLERSWLRELKGHVLDAEKVAQVHAFEFEQDSVSYAAVVYIAGVNPQTKMNDGNSFSRFIQAFRDKSAPYFSLYPRELDVARSPLNSFHLDPMEDSKLIHHRYICFTFDALRRWRGEQNISTNDICVVKLRRLAMLLQNRSSVEAYITINPRSSSWFDNRTPGGAVEMIHLTRDVREGATDRELAATFRTSIKKYRDGDLRDAYYAPARMQAFPKPVLPVWSIQDGNIFVNPRNALRDLRGTKPSNLAHVNTDFHHIVFPAMPENSELYGENNACGCVDLSFEGYVFKLYLTNEQVALIDSKDFHARLADTMEGLEFQLREKCPG